MRIVLALLLAGCAITTYERDGPDAQGYSWERTGPVGKPVIHRDVDVYLFCMFEEKTKACSVHVNGECHIYLPKKPEPWLEAHELRHCDGWRHPDWTRGVR